MPPPCASRMMLLMLACLVGVALTSDTCGYQCSSDEDCKACGSVGKCSSPASATKYPSIAATCVDAPDGAPSDPKPNVADSVWPQQWKADVRTWTYSDFSSKAVVAKGTFYYDGKGGHSRGDWHPYINGKDATQVWIGNDGSGKSKYYVKSGVLCIYFSIHDPGTSGSSVGIEYPDWMLKCDKGGMAKYMGRQQVDGEWVDHYACVIDYAAVNQTIVFQNWHSLGLGKTPKGLPVRVTGGNSAPNGQKGSPRLNTVWYTNFTVGEEAVKDSDFVKPSWFCIPVGASEVADFLGVKELSASLLRDPEVHKRLHYFAHRQPAKSDLLRARRKKPRAEIAGSSFPDAMTKLNRILRAEKGLATKACADFSLEALHEVQHEIFAARSPALQELYKGDRRSLPYNSASELSEAHQERVLRGRARPDLVNKMRDGLCHELVLMYMHHLSEAARIEIRTGHFQLPLLPEGDLHASPAAEAADDHDKAAHADYSSKVSCAICHVTNAGEEASSFVV
eukprot:TRINITY_DN3912_c0_g1_i1.p1 TRINITY_DN3912_c0_g1~~TRINITY_DN3912_c0_g1_i1.p1  ORF type:complete len:532 (-),score=66.51 TRINITY_DN3912_c0_g1_i1:289-1812(-)